MKNRYLKYSVILVTLSVSVGVVLFGFNAASAVGVPSQTPDKSNAVAPTFSGLNVTGDATIKNDLMVENDAVIIKNLLTLGKTTVTKVLNAQGGIENTKTAGGVDLPVTFLDNATFDKKLDVTGETTLSGKVVAKGNLDVVGQLNTGQNWFDSSYIKRFIAVGKGYNGSTQNGNITISTDGDVTADLVGAGLRIGSKTLALGMDGNEIISLGGNFYINRDNGKAVEIGSTGVPSDLKISGTATAETFEATGWLKTHDLWADSTLWSNGDSYFNNISVFKDGVGGTVTIKHGTDGGVKIDGGVLNVHNTVDLESSGKGGGLFVGDKAGKYIGMDGNEIMSFGDTLALNWDNGKDVEIGGGGGKTANLKVASGKVTSKNGFGTTYTWASGWQSYSKGAWQTGSTYLLKCPGGQQILSCEFDDEFSDHDNVNMKSRIIQNGNSCKYTFDTTKNNYGGAARINFFGTCLNPTY